MTCHACRYIEIYIQGANPAVIYGSIVNGQDRFAAIEWVGNAKNELMEFPAEVVQRFGRELRHLQTGEAPRGAVRPMSSIGPGVFELKDSDESAWYRVLYLSVVDG